jgi:uncharacterized protein YdeI (YjbR/CyaY-like superfamily)
VTAGDYVRVTLELDSGYRQVEVPSELAAALQAAGLNETFHELTYSIRREFVRQINDARADTTRTRRLQKIIAALRVAE